MKTAVIINVGHGAQALSQAVKTQALLLDHMGARLDSIRLAAPRLLRPACLAAVAERPDLLVIAGGPRAARRAAQIAHDQKVPILFLPGVRVPAWAKDLWGSLTIEYMVAALAREQLLPVGLAAGCAEGQLFFDNLSLGLLPQIAELHQAYGEAESFSEGWNVLSRAANAAGLLFRSDIRIRCNGAIRRAGTLVVKAQHIAQRNGQTPRFCCTTWRHGVMSYALGLIESVGGVGERHSTRAERFECEDLTIEGASATWFLLDSDPVLIQTPVTFRLLPRAVETFAFAPDFEAANDNSARHRLRFKRRGVSDGGTPGNFRPGSHVDYANATKAKRY